MPAGNGQLCSFIVHLMWQLAFIVTSQKQSCIPRLDTVLQNWSLWYKTEMAATIQYPGQGEGRVLSIVKAVVVTCLLQPNPKTTIVFLRIK